MYNLRVLATLRVAASLNAIAPFSSAAQRQNVFVVEPLLDVFSDRRWIGRWDARFTPARDGCGWAGCVPAARSPFARRAQGRRQGGFDLTWPFAAAAGVSRQTGSRRHRCSVKGARFAVAGGGAGGGAPNPSSS